MRLRGPARCLAVALFASLLSPVALPSAPAAASTFTCTTTADDGTAGSDFYPTSPTAWSDGENTRIRVLRPTGGIGCPAKPTAGWPVIVYLHGWGGNRCSDSRWVTRATLASWGYVVVSFNGRGMPAAYGLGGSGCDPAADAADALDDNGNDFAGPSDMQDISQVIDWVRDKYAPAGSGCVMTSPTNCADTNLVGITGHSYGGMRSWMMGVGPTANPKWDTRVKAVAPEAAGFTFDNVKNLSNNGAATNPAFQPRASSASLTTWSHYGWMAHLQKTTVPLGLDGERDQYVNQTPSTTVSDYWNTRMLLNDDAAIDKAADVNVPLLAMHGFLDALGGVWTEPHVEAWRKLNRTDKYLYLGSCSHEDDPCLATNATRLRDTLRRFMDRHVKGETTTYVRPPGTTNCAQTGPCVIYTVPPKWTSSSSNPWTIDGWPEGSSPDWPPTSGTTTETRWFQDSGSLTGTTPTGTGCSAAGTPPVKGTGCSTFANDKNYPVAFGFCLGARYGLNEVQSFDWVAGATERKLGRVEADLHVSSTTTRLQVNVDLYLVTGTVPNEVETRIWRGNAQIVPVKRDGVANTPYHFVFRPGGSAWTIGAGQKLRFKVASKLAGSFAGEPLPGTYTLHHSSTYPSKVTLTYVP